MTQANTPMPGEDPGALIEEDIEGNPQLQPEPQADVPEYDDPTIKDAKQQPT
ncbi:hypothetical protein PUR23_07200 [Methylorubrum populi]|jgi:hypothetical protein|uniref:hypothetical protein n=1 Tax=Methylorubrum populi TaxID=223967 RepID=UPI0013013211|nr:hypothetical protein [Methylorubrum populi]